MSPLNLRVPPPAFRNKALALWPPRLNAQASPGLPVGLTLPYLILVGPPEPYVWHLGCGPLGPLTPLEWSCSTTPQGIQCRAVAQCRSSWVPRTLHEHRTPVSSVSQNITLGSLHPLWPFPPYKVSQNFHIWPFALSPFPLSNILLYPGSSLLCDPRFASYLKESFRI